MDLEGKVAVVTGAADGIGLALCERFAAAGMNVVMADVAADALTAAAERIAAAHRVQTLAVPTDVRSCRQVAELERRSLDRFGAVHVLCNNAGVQMPGKAWEFTRTEWEWLLDVNLGGVVRGIATFLPGMIARGEPGHVVNTASIGGLVAHPRTAMYTASKYAVVGLSETLACDLVAEGASIGVSVLCPGATVSRLRENSAALQPAGGRGRKIPTVTGAARLAAAEVARQTVDAIRSRRFWILTHPEYNDLILARAAGIVANDALVTAGG
jgi:NAD(P)-dependent dehydrogenase (short-subunit alcohol dehydrogenase family)